MSDNVTAPNRVKKQPSERRQYTMDFSGLMATGETILSSPAQYAPSVVSSTIGDEASTLTIETPEISGQTVTMWISGGVNRTRYRVECTIYTSAGQTLEGDGILVVEDEK